MLRSRGCLTRSVSTIFVNGPFPRQNTQMSPSVRGASTALTVWWQTWKILASGSRTRSRRRRIRQPWRFVRSDFFSYLFLFVSWPFRVYRPLDGEWRRWIMHYLPVDAKQIKFVATLENFCSLWALALIALVARLFIESRIASQILVTFFFFSCLKCSENPPQFEKDKAGMWNIPWVANVTIQFADCSFFLPWFCHGMCASIVIHGCLFFVPVFHSSENF